MLALNIINNDKLMNNNDMQYEEIRIDQIPKNKRWRYVPLYRISTEGEISHWQIGFDGINNLEINHGLLDDINDIINNEKIIVESNTNIWSQSLIDARKYYKLKLKEGYQPAGAATPPIIKAMKGNEYKEGAIKMWPVYTQPKIHGIRMLSQNTNKNHVKEHSNKIIMKSWLNNTFTNLNHIEDELSDFFDYLPRYAILDGELYNHDMTFSTLTSAVKTVKTIHPKLADVHYYIFDIDYLDTTGTPFEKRYELLVNAFKRFIQDRSPTNRDDDITALPKTFTIVQSQLAMNHTDIIKQHNDYVKIGYEGIMIKKISNGSKQESKLYLQSLYKSGKNNNILKYKDFKDEEVIILNYNQRENNQVYFNVKDTRNNIFIIKMKGDNIIHYDNSVIGKQMTIRYQQLSMTGVPESPIGIAIRDYE